MKKNVIQSIFFICIFLLYIVIRMPSLLSHSVAYTYDQGRDFIAGANIILTHHIPFIGPTTGINGLFHGSWWYYYLTIPFLIFKGLPIGYYYANLFIHFMSLVVFMWFIKTKTNYISALFAGLFITFSPYFIFTSLFVGNNIMVLPVLLLFLITNFFIFEKGGHRHILFYFINGLLLGLIAEFELSFGLFIIPTYFIAHAIFPQLRRVAGNITTLSLSLLGLLIAFMPRILFELKNNFVQTKILLSFITKPKLYNPKPFNDILYDRAVLFLGYWKGIFPDIYWCYFFSSVIIITFIYLFVRKKQINTYIIFLGYFIAALFLFSLTYKDNFWGNYYEGIQYSMVFIMILVISQIHLKQKMIQYIFFCVIFVFFLTQTYSAVLANRTPPQKDGLAVQEEVMKVILQKESTQKDFCVRIYTPPVIPHTYNYLFTYNKLQEKINIPSSEWIEGTCWFIVEADSYQKRRDDWLIVHTPKDKNEVVVTKLKDVEVRYYKVLPK